MRPGSHKRTSIPISNCLRGIVPTALFDANIGFAFLDDGGVFSDDTTDANSAAAGDVPLMPAVEVANDAFYFGENFSTSAPFNSIKITIATPGIGGTIAWEYYNGATWVAVPGLVDNTVGLTASAGAYYIIFTEPADWAHVAVNGQDRYWIRARVTAANFTTIPVATQIWIGRRPTNLQNCTDGDETTITGVGTGLVSAANYFGYLYIDMLTAKNRIWSARVKLYSSAGTVSVYVQESADGGVIYSNHNGGLIIAGQTSTSGTEMNTQIFQTSSRYIRLGFYCSAAATANMYISTMKAYEVGA